MRFVYLDESGISDNEPITVVAGAIIEGDEQYNLVISSLADIVERNVPDRFRNKFVLHATDLFSSSKKFQAFGWNLEKRLSVLDEILYIPRALRIPISYGYARKRDNVSTALRHVAAMSFCLDGAERYLRLRATTETAITICEDTPATRAALREIQNGMRSGDFSLPGGVGSLQRISGALHFSKKSEDPVLQLVDACVFATTRWINALPHRRRQFESLCGSLEPYTAGTFAGALGQSVFDWLPQPKYTFGSILS